MYVCVCVCVCALTVVEVLFVENDEVMEKKTNVIEEKNTTKRIDNGVPTIAMDVNVAEKAIRTRLFSGPRSH